MLLDFLKWGREKNSSLGQVPKQLHVFDVSRQQQSIQKTYGTKAYIQLIGISDMNLDSGDRFKHLIPALRCSALPVTPSSLRYPFPSHWKEAWTPPGFNSTLPCHKCPSNQNPLANPQCCHALIYIMLFCNPYPARTFSVTHLLTSKTPR